MFGFIKKSVKEAQEVSQALELMKMDTQEATERVIDKVFDDEEDEWIWVPGYKATDWNLRGWEGFQFEIGKLYELGLDEEPEVCKKGFHFCPKAKFVRQYYSCGRLFKVEAQIRKSTWLKAEMWLKENPDGVSYWAFQRYGNREPDYMKIAARAVRLVEEIPTEQAWEQFPRRHYIDGPEDFAFFSNFIAEGHSEEDFYHYKWNEGLKAFDVHETLANILFDQFRYKSYSCDHLRFFEGMIQSGASRDMALYMLIKRVDEQKERDRR